MTAIDVAVFWVHWTPSIVLTSGTTGNVESTIVVTPVFSLTAAPMGSD